MSDGRLRICIVGGGSLGHVVAGFLAARHDVRVSVLTRRPALWGDVVTVTDLDGKVYDGAIERVTASAQEVVPGADVVLLCLPGFAIEPSLAQVGQWLSPATLVGSVVSSTGFFLFAHRILPEATPLFGFQRVPFIARVERYGHAARLLGYKPSLNVAVENADGNEVAALLSRLFGVPVHLLGSHFEATLTNSNPLLHPSRLFTMWRDHEPGMTYGHCPEFYADWTDEASQLYIDMDAEFQQLLRHLPVSEGAIPTALDYYESHDAPSLTAKLRSIPAFKGIKAPMRRLDDGTFVPDFTSRYFTEDFPYGMGLILTVAREHGITVPTIERVHRWGMEKC